MTFGFIHIDLGFLLFAVKAFYVCLKESSHCTLFKLYIYMSIVSQQN